MKLLYTARVIFISLEFLLILTGISLILHDENNYIDRLIISTDDDFSKWLIGLPLALIVWNIKESALTLNFSGTHAKKLLNWNSYWKLKIHISASIFYAVSFLMINLFSWLAYSGLKTPMGIYFYTLGTLGQMIVAASLYFAKLRIFEILNKHV